MTNAYLNSFSKFSTFVISTNEPMEIFYVFCYTTLLVQNTNTIQIQSEFKKNLTDLVDL